MRSSGTEKPWWVRMSLWGLPSRSAVWACCWASIASALACIAAAIVMADDVRWIAGAGSGAACFFAAAVAYWRAIAWMDAHRGW